MIRPEQGDVVLDGGGCFGDTALQFAQAVGMSGQVHTFEFVPHNLAVLQQNIDLNPGYESRIRIAPYAMYSSSGSHLAFQDRGPSTNLELGHESSDGAETISIDDYVAQCGLEGVDYIKMDIEGAEYHALMGFGKVLSRKNAPMVICEVNRYLPGGSPTLTPVRPVTLETSNAFLMA